MAGGVQRSNGPTIRSEVQTMVNRNMFLRSVMEYCLLNPKYWAFRYAAIDIAYRKYTFPEFTLNYTYKSYLKVNPHSFRGAKLE